VERAQASHRHLYWRRLHHGWIYWIHQQLNNSK
jgi:hypothetical protein